LLISPTVWLVDRWWTGDRWRHAEDLAEMTKALGLTAATTVVASIGAWFTHRALAFVLPVVVLARLAHSAGHRVTITASSVVSSALLLAMPMWIHESTGWTPGTATMLIISFHLAISAIAIEASARWHARALLSGVVDVSNDAVLIVDGGGRVMTGNDAARRAFGGDLAGAGVGDLFPELAHADLPQISGQTLAGHGFDGRPLLMEISVGSVDAPGRPMSAIVCRDMAEVVAAAESLQRSAEIIDNAPDLVAGTDPSANLVVLNGAGRARGGAGQAPGGRAAPALAGACGGSGRTTPDRPTRAPMFPHAAPLDAART
jgi:PAS domain-containing protein